ncbi:MULTISPECIES: SPOR domain-containing protein [unclassified Gilliamella]|uniref:SPOR domain-containing protein n=1 Tax=unclassified Gilliamella TaxID=2685620 RepID=UPI001305A030|nr:MULTISPECIES: SPOR domain-containing protein [unclassified Gilliamella]MWP49963.1 hypothetical protein [Gilliamella sp. Lep-s35]MWP69644.1 hypothetical protein [Gilliamella sp. Lep-s5]MWP77987.1 hypothetical protein [Gilliamella sp. Lep-s21]
MTGNQQSNSNNQNKVRNRLVGFATLLLIIAAIAPWIITDKPNLPISTTPIFQAEDITHQEQIVASSNDINDNFSNNVSEVPYIPDSDQNSSTLVFPDILDDADTTTTIKTVIPEQETKPYMIQLTALKNRQKIEELVALLKLNNYSVRTLPQNPAPNQLIKLQVGPYAKKEQADQVLIDLNNLTKLKGIIVAN